ncbi:MAG: methyltransferase domain-containing protein [Ottowia sp.]|uniref:methyltransferase domain-containing protein n=1 Tax=Ottowia sp. TaxID=1898956 RepID=UPI0039E36D3E
MIVPPAAACFGWSARAWARPWTQFVRSRPGMRFNTGLEIGAGPRSSLAPLMLAFTERVECSAFDAAQLPAIQALNARLLPPAQAARIAYTRQDVRAPQGRWDVIVLKSVLGGVHRVHDSRLMDVHATLARLAAQHLNPGGLLVTLDNGRTALEPLLARLGARRNGWRFFRREDFPPAEARFSFGVLGVASAATRLGALGARIDDALYLADRLLSPLARQHAVHLHVYRAAS